MTDAPRTEGDRTPEEEVWSAIGAFEQILEQMPEDQASLDALWRAYERIGDRTRAGQYLVRLAHVLLQADNRAAVEALRETLQGYAADDASAGEVLERLGAAPAPAESAGTLAQAAAPGASEPAVGRFSMADELSCAWNLMEAGELTQDEYARVVQDLTELSTQDAGATVSVMHVLEGRGIANLERVLGYMARECGAPVIGLSNFDVNLDAARLLPFDFMVERGVAVFELLGKDALAVVLNPFHEQLRDDVRTLTRRTCHFYVTTASDFDNFIDRVRDALEADGEPAR